MRNLNCNVLSAADNQTTNGIQIDSNQLFGMSFQAYFGDTQAAGTFKIQVSNDVAPIQYSSNSTFTVSHWVDLPSATTPIVSGGSAIITVNPSSYRWMRAVYTTSATGAQHITATADNGVKQTQTVTTVADHGAKEVTDITLVADTGAFEVGTVTTIADTGAFEISTITTVADVAGSLNSTFFTFSAMNSGGLSQTAYYVWYNINGSGVDPAPGGTGIQVTAATNASDAAIAVATRSAITAIAGARVTVSGLTNQVIVTGRFMGNATNAADGTAPTGFVFVDTNGAASNLLNKYFTFSALNTAGSATNYYVWYNVNSEGTDPAPPLLTGISVAIAAGSADTAVASATRSALVASALITVSGATNQAILTANFVGNPASIADGAAPTGFTLVPTDGAASNLNSSYFSYQTRNSGGASTNNRYVWYNVNGQGIDPSVPASTGIAVVLAAGDSANTVASATRSALVADTRVAITGAANHCIITNNFMGSAVDAANGAVSPGFSYSITQGAASNLNSTNFTLSSIDLITLVQKNFYMWFNINSEGTDPLLPGRTAIPITGVPSVSGSTLATSMRAALNALTNDFTATGAGSNVIITNVADGPVPVDTDGTPPTGFTFGSATLGVVSTLSGKYFLLNSAGSPPGTRYYVWIDVDSISTDPAPAGLTGCRVIISSGSSANTIGGLMATAIAALNTSADFSASNALGVVTVTNLTAGPFTPASDFNTGFAFSVTGGGSTTVNVTMNAMGI